MRYRKKPVVITAHEWSGGETEGIKIAGWVNERGGHAYYVSETEEDSIRDYDEYVTAVHGRKLSEDAEPLIVIRTMEGLMRARPGNFIIEGVQGEHYPCAGDIFRATYEPVEDQ